METIVLNLCGFWLWLTRKQRTSRYSEVAHILHSARTYLWADYATRASTLDRGALLPEHSEALVILERQAALVAHTSNRFATISECRKLISEEFSESQKAA
jgi:hypothetical protein